jgi:hypothetical protein
VAVFLIVFVAISLTLRRRSPRVQRALPYVCVALAVYEGYLAVTADQKTVVGLALPVLLLIVGIAGFIRRRKIANAGHTEDKK